MVNVQDKLKTAVSANMGQVLSQGTEGAKAYNDISNTLNANEEWSEKYKKVLIVTTQKDFLKELTVKVERKKKTKKLQELAPLEDIQHPYLVLLKNLKKLKLRKLQVLVHQVHMKQRLLGQSQ
jgi:hypothetical protein